MEDIPRNHTRIQMQTWLVLNLFMIQKQIARNIQKTEEIGKNVVAVKLERDMIMMNFICRLRVTFIILCLTFVAFPHAHHIIKSRKCLEESTQNRLCDVK